MKPTPTVDGSNLTPGDIYMVKNGKQWEGPYTLGSNNPHLYNQVVIIDHKPPKPKTRFIYLIDGKNSGDLADQGVYVNLNEIQCREWAYKSVTSGETLMRDYSGDSLDDWYPMTLLSKAITDRILASGLDEELERDVRRDIVRFN